jgi:hypothetical protein
MDRRTHVYARQKLSEALHWLVDEGPLRRRLTNVITPISQLITSGSVSDPELLAALVRLKDELTQSPLEVAGYPRPRSHLTTRRAKEIAGEILDLYTKVQGGL